MVGVGLNVNLTPGQLNKLPAPASSLKAASGKAWDRAELLASILEEAGQLYPAVLAGDWTELSAEYDRRSLLIDREVTVRDNEVIRQGKALGVASDGALLLEEVPGQTTVIRHGDVSVLSVAGKDLKPA